MYLDSYLYKKSIKRDEFLKDDTNDHISGKLGSQLWVQTASAKVSGRGGTKQFIHWSEVAFYSNTDIINAEDLVTGAERQVHDGVGKIFRESTGNISDDFFQREYKLGKNGVSDFKSRFFPWFLHLDYTLQAPTDWTPPEYYNKILDQGVTVDQCHWHYKKTRGLTDEKMMREYPSFDTEAFLLGGKPYFLRDALIYYENHTREPIKEALYVQNI